MIELNKELLKLYKLNWDNLSKELTELTNSQYTTHPTNPLLIRIGNELKFHDADIRIVIFGQETNDWGDDFKNGIEYIQSIYDDFFVTRRCFSYGGQFWNGIGRFLKMIEDQYPDKSVEFVWNNVVKIGKSGGKGMPPAFIYQIEERNFSILKRELEILRPNLVLFLSGPNYDHILKNQFEKIKFEAVEGFTQRQLAKVDIKNVDFAFRTYHPNYLWRNGINNYYDAILNKIKFN